MHFLSVSRFQRIALSTLTALLATLLLLPAAAQQKASPNSKHTLFEFRGPSLKAPLVGYFYSADEQESFTIIQGDKQVPIPFTKIQQIQLTPSDDRFSKVAVTRTDGTSVSGRFANMTLMFVDSKTEKGLELPLSDPNDSLADFGNRAMVNCAY